VKVGIFTFLATACSPSYYAVRIEDYIRYCLHFRDEKG